jgi:AsmA protein
MPRAVKIILFAISGFVGLLVLLALALLFFVDANAYKPRLEVAASQALGMEVKVGGRLGFGFFPGLLITLEDAHIRNRGMDLVSAKEARLAIDLLPLLHEEVRISEIALQQPKITIERDRDGQFNFEKPEAVKADLPALNLDKVSLEGATLQYTDQQTGAGIEAVDCRLALYRPRLARGKSPEFIKNLSFTAELACGEIRKNDFTLYELTLTAVARQGVFDLKPITLRFFGGYGSGDIQTDFSGAAPAYRVVYALEQFRLEELSKVVSPQHIAEGWMDFSADLALQGKTLNELKQTAAGQVALRGENLKLDGADLDKKFDRYESTQSFNLADVGAFFLGGPVGVAVTKGYSIARIFEGAGGRSEIRQLVSEWKVEHGVAQAQDVALATPKNRLALTGGLDFINERFENMTMALIDAKGCALVRQNIHGTFQKPVVEKPGIFKTLTGPALKLLKKGRELLPGGECEVFYAGTVASPK